MPLFLLFGVLIIIVDGSYDDGNSVYLIAYKVSTQRAVAYLQLKKTLVN